MIHRKMQKEEEHHKILYTLGLIPPLVASCITLVQLYSQRVDVGAAHRP